MRRLTLSASIVLATSVLAISAALVLARQAEPQPPWLVFRTNRIGDIYLYRMHPDGSGTQRLSDAGALASPGAVVATPDGHWLHYQFRKNDVLSLFRVNPITGEHRVLPLGGLSADIVGWQAGGDWLLVDRNSNIATEIGGLYRLRAADGRRATLVSPIGLGDIADGGRFAPLHPLLTPDRTGVVVTLEGELWRIDLPTGTRHQLTDIGGTARALAWLPDGRLAFDATVPELATLSTLRPDGSIDVITTTLGPGPFAHDWRLDWSPDGDWIVFSRLEEAGRLMYRSRPDGSEAEALFERPGTYFVEHWDGNIAYISGSYPPPTESILYRLPIDGDQREIIATSDGRTGFGMALSPDGRWLLYRQGQVFHLINQHGGADRQIDTGIEAVWFATWSPDSQWLYFHAGGDLHRIHIDGTRHQNLTQRAAGIAFVTWVPPLDRPWSPWPLIIGALIAGSLAIAFSTYLAHNEEHRISEATEELHP